MWFIQRYMQFGFGAFEEIIQVSDHPVVPSLGFIAVDRHGPSALISWTYNGHVVPMTMSRWRTTGSA